MVYWDYGNPWKQLDHMAENNEGTKLFGEIGFCASVVCDFKSFFY